MPYPYWDRMTQSGPAMMTSQVQSNSIDSSENATPTIDLTYSDTGHDDTKPDITDLLSDTTRVQENVERNHDNNEWIDVPHLQDLSPRDDVTGVRKDKINKNMEESVGREQTLPHQTNILRAVLLTNCIRTDVDKRRNENEKKVDPHVSEANLTTELSTSKQKEAEEIIEQPITTISIEDSEDEGNEDSGVEWVNESVGEDVYNEDNAQMKNNTSRIKIGVLLKGQSRKDNICQFASSDQTRCSSVVEENTAVSETSVQVHTKDILELTPSEGRNQNEERSLQVEKQTASVQMRTDNPEKTANTGSILQTILSHPQPTQGLLIETILESILSTNLSTSKQKEAGEISKERVERIQDIVTPSGIQGKQKQSTTIIIEDSDKDDEEVVVEEKIEVEENMLQPGGQYSMANKHNVLDDSVAQSSQAMVKPYVQSNTLDCRENTPLIQQILSCQWYKCMPCGYSTGIAIFFQAHLESESHKCVEIRTRQNKEHSLVERNSKMLQTNVCMNASTAKRKKGSETIKKRIRRKQDHVTSSRRKKNEKQTTVIIEDSDKHGEDNIEVEKNLMKHKQWEIGEVPANNHGVPTQRTPSSELYKCDVCHYSTKLKFHFEIHLQSERHKCALQEKQTGKSDSTSNIVKTNARRVRRKRTGQNEERSLVEKNPKTLEASINAKRKEASDVIKQLTKKKQHQIAPSGRKKKQKQTTAIIIEGSDKEDDVIAAEKVPANKDNVRTQQEPQWYECEICHYATERRYYFQKHLEGRRHKYTVQKQSGNSNCTNIEIKTKQWYKCEICNYKTELKDCIDFHFQSKFHIDSVLAAASGKHLANEVERNGQEAKENYCDLQKMYNCSSCTYVTKSELDLKVHIFDIHSPRGSFKWYWCNICTFKTRDRHSFKYHLRSSRHKANVSTVEIKEKFESSVKEAESEMIVDEVIEDVEADAVEINESNPSTNSVDWTETEVFVEEEEESEFCPEILHCGRCNFVSGSELDLQRHIVDEHRVVDKVLSDSRSLNTTESTSVQFHVLGEERVAAEEKVVITEECEDWTEINVEEDKIVNTTLRAIIKLKRNRKVFIFVIVATKLETI